MKTKMLRVSKRLVASYIFDWVVIIGTAAVGGGFYVVEPNHNPFSLSDLSISYPYRNKDTVSTGVLVVIGLIAPAVIIAVLSIFVAPGPTVDQHSSRARIWRQKLWEWHVGWMGLAFAVASAFMATQGLKNLFGKPRPDLIARCNPDLSAIAAHTVSGLGDLVRGAPTLVDYTICQNQNKDLTRDGFASYPSGHSSFSWAGLLYLTLWLSAKLCVTIPYLSYRPFTRSLEETTFAKTTTTHSAGLKESGEPSGSAPQSLVTVRHQGAAPPLYLFVVLAVPIGTAFFVAASRWTDHRHAGFDIISGSILGSFFAILGFYLYHLPIHRGAGWSWGPRSRSHAFYRGIGHSGYVGDEGWSSAHYDRSTPASNDADVERAEGGNGLAQTENGGRVESHA